MRFVFSSIQHPEIIEGMCRWAGPRIGSSFDPERTTGFSVMCAHGCATILYTDYTPNCDVRIHAAGAGNWLNRSVLGVVFGYPFQELDVRRITALVAKKNRRSRKLVEGVGFKREGCARKAVVNGDDLMIYGMLRRECRWLKEDENGQVERAETA